MREKEGGRKRGQCPEGNGKLEIDVGKATMVRTFDSVSKSLRTSVMEIYCTLSQYPKNGGAREASRQDVWKIWTGLVVGGVFSAISKVDWSTNYGVEPKTNMAGRRLKRQVEAEGDPRPPGRERKAGMDMCGSHGERWG